MKKIYLLFGFIFLIKIAGFTQGLTVSVVVTPTSCNSALDGSVTATVSNGVPPYQYTLDGITYTSSNIFTGLQANSYVLNIYDANNTHGFAIFDILDGDSIRGTPVTIRPSCMGADDGQIDFNFQNGNAPYLFTNAAIGFSGYSNGTGNDFTGGLPAGTYVFDITDAIGCVGEITGVVIQDGEPAFTHAGNDTLLCTAGSAVQLSGSNVCSTMIYPSYSWSPSTGLSLDYIPNPVATPLATTTYVLTSYIPGFNSIPFCVTRDSVTISVVDLVIPQIVLNGSRFSISNFQTGGNYTWQVLDGSSWQDIPSATGVSYIATAPGDYRAKITNAVCEQYSEALNYTSFARNAYGIAMYPNPATSTLNLAELNQSDEWQTLEILNSQGITLSGKIDIKNRTSVSLAIDGLVKGVYMLKFSGAYAKSTVLRFIKF